MKTKKEIDKRFKNMVGRGLLWSPDRYDVGWCKALEWVLDNKRDDDG